MEKKNSFFRNILVDGLVFIALAHPATATPDENSARSRIVVTREYFDVVVQAKFRPILKSIKPQTSDYTIVRFKVVPEARIVDAQKYLCASDPRLDTYILEAADPALFSSSMIIILPEKNTGLLGSMNFSYGQSKTGDKKNQSLSQVKHSLESENQKASVHD